MIDIIFVFLMLAALAKGFSKGMVGAAFSFAAFFIALAAALKLSATVAGWLMESSGSQGPWWPVIAFLLVFAVVSGLVKMAAGVVEKTLDFAMLGWLNKLAGFVLYAILFTLLYSVALFYYDQIRGISAVAREESRVYAYIEPWGEWTMQAIGNIIPQFKDVFSDMQEFFEKVGNDIKKTS